MRRAERAVIGIALGVAAIEIAPGCSGDEFTSAGQAGVSGGGAAGRAGAGGTSALDGGGSSAVGGSAGKSGSGGVGGGGSAGRGGSQGGAGTAGANGTGGSGGAGGSGGSAGVGGSAGFGGSAGVGGSGGCTSDADCSSLNTSCASGRCDPGRRCVTAPTREGLSCNDGLLCTTGDACGSGNCTGAPLLCPATSEPCRTNRCDELTGQCALQHAPEGTPCNDSVACTSGDLCRAGVCGGTPLVSCINGDGCCPSGCLSSTDSDCPGCVNRALTAVASSSGGGTTNFAADKMNDGVGEMACTTNHWIINSSTMGGWIQLDWASPLTLASLYIETPNVSGVGCSVLPGRNIASAVVEWWNGASWVPLRSLSGFVDDVKADFPAVTTTKLRLSSVLSGLGNGNSIIYEWHVYSQPGCVPPP